MTALGFGIAVGACALALALVVVWGRWRWRDRRRRRARLDDLEAWRSIQGQADWLAYRDLVEQEVFPDARPRSEVVVSLDLDGAAIAQARRILGASS